MGYPLGPIKSNIFMGYIELSYILDFKNKLWYLRYADDCFVQVRIEKTLNEFLNTLNRAHNCISFIN